MPHFDDFTPSQGPGPFYGMILMFDGAPNGGIDRDDPDALIISGQIMDAKGQPIRPPDGLLEFLTADEFARTTTDIYGRYEVVMRRPTAYELPDGRMQAPFIWARMFAFPLVESFDTRLYLSDNEQANANDPVLNMLSEKDRDSIIGKVDGQNVHWDVYFAGENQTAWLVPTDGPSIADARETKVHPAILEARSQ